MRLVRLAAVALLSWAAPAVAQGPLSVRPPTGNAPPALEVGAILADPALAEALESGLPVRLRFRVELWRDEFLDDLVGDEAFTLVLRYEPLERRFDLIDGRARGSIRGYASYPRLREQVEVAYPLSILPRGRGRYYYLAALEVETLSLSDLDELQGWLGGELSPAVEGERSILGAIGAGMSRLFIRVLGLPTRRHEARSPYFRVP